MTSRPTLTQSRFLTTMLLLTLVGCGSDDEDFGAYAGTWSRVSCEVAQVALPNESRPCDDNDPLFASIETTGDFELLTDTTGGGVPSLPGSRLLRRNGRVETNQAPIFRVILLGTDGLRWTQPSTAVFPPSGTAEPATTTWTWTRTSSEPVDPGPPLAPSR